MKVFPLRLKKVYHVNSTFSSKPRVMGIRAHKVFTISKTIMTIDDTLENFPFKLNVF